MRWILPLFFRMNMGQSLPSASCCRIGFTFAYRISCCSNIIHRMRLPQLRRAINGISTRGFDRLPLSVMHTRLGRQIEMQARQEDARFHVYFSGPSSLSIIPLCAQGTTAIYCTHMALISSLHTLGNDINIFPLHDGRLPVSQILSLLWYKQRYLLNYSCYFMKLLFDFAETCGATQLARVV